MKTIMVEKFVKPVVTAGPQETLAAVGRLMEQHNVGAVVLAEDHRPVGIVTDRDLALHVAARGVPLQTPVARVMSSPVQTVGRDDGVFYTTHSMMESRVRRLPVVDDDGRPVGIVTLDDLLRVLGRELSNLVDGIRSEMEVK
jgi:signal-transduction protein with cAMP-binding, CBS, and nucleotidyltransferase domain